MAVRGVRTLAGMGLSTHRVEDQLAEHQRPKVKDVGPIAHLLSVQKVDKLLGGVALLLRRDTRGESSRLMNVDRHVHRQFEDTHNISVERVPCQTAC